jgi:hypothetical protein
MDLSRFVGRYSQLSRSPQQKKAQAQAEENPGYIPATAEKLQRDSKNSYADGATETDEVCSSPEADSLANVARKCLDRLFEKPLPHKVSGGDCVNGRKNEGDPNP